MCAGFVLWVGQKPVLESQKEPRDKKDSKGYKQAKKGARSLRYLGPDLLETTSASITPRLFSRCETRAHPGLIQSPLSSPTLPNLLEIQDARRKFLLGLVTEN